VLEVVFEVNFLKYWKISRRSSQRPGRLTWIRELPRAMAMPARGPWSIALPRQVALTIIIDATLAIFLLDLAV
jgi:hypothetical protein